VATIAPNNPLPASASAATTCRALADDALATIPKMCGGQDADKTNSVCYGYESIQVKSAGADTSAFSAKGQRIDLAGIAALMTSPADIETGTWGVALVNIQAGLPAGNAPLRAILFGEATLTSVVKADTGNAVLLPVKTIDEDPVLLRAAASPNEPQVTRLQAGQKDAVADGRNAAGTWVRVRLATDKTTLVGWANALQVKVTGDIKTLPVLDDRDVTPAFLYTAPLQAFTLVTGSKTACPEASAGLILQLSGKETARLLVNGAEVSFSTATLLLRAIAKDSLDVMVISGAAAVRAAGAEVALDAGSATKVRLGGTDGLTANAAPKAATKYPFAAVAGLPATALNGGLPCMAGAATATARVNIKTGPGNKEYSTLSTLRADQTYLVAGWAADSAGAHWWKLASEAKQENWVEQAAVRTVGMCDAVAKAESAQAASASSGSTGGTTGAVPRGFAPTTQTIWDVVPTQDKLVGECTRGALNYCPLMVALKPEGNAISYRGAELQPYRLNFVRENVYSYSGRNTLGDGKVNMTLTFTSPTTLVVNQAITLDVEPKCQHTYIFTATFKR
jgi:hypothetical protein